MFIRMFKSLFLRYTMNAQIMFESISWQKEKTKLILNI